MPGPFARPDPCRPVAARAAAHSFRHIVPARSPILRRAAVRLALHPAPLVLAALVACGGDAPPADAPSARPLEEPAGATTPAAQGAPAGAMAIADSAGASDDCPMRGLWRRCAVVERLERSGFGVEVVPDTVRQPGLSIAGSVLRLGASELQLFLYADSADARREAAGVRPDDAEPAAVRGIRRAPAVIHSMNLVALYFNNDDHRLERVQLAITAGLPPG